MITIFPSDLIRLLAESLRPQAWKLLTDEPKEPIYLDIAKNLTHLVMLAAPASDPLQALLSAWLALPSGTLMLHESSTPGATDALDTFAHENNLTIERKTDRLAEDSETYPVHTISLTPSHYVTVFPLRASQRAMSDTTSTGYWAGKEETQRDRETRRSDAGRDGEIVKSNDAIPADEMLLAEALAAAKARGLGFSRTALFRDKQGFKTKHDDTEHPPVACCAMGALILAGIIEESEQLNARAIRISSDVTSRGVWHGNDSKDTGLWNPGRDRGESLGYAFRCAMTGGDS